MMTKMRENTAVILWILVAAFVATIVFSWGMGGFDTVSKGSGTTVASVNGEDIEYREYERLITNRLQQSGDVDPATTRPFQCQSQRIDGGSGCDHIVHNDNMRIADNPLRDPEPVAIAAQAAGRTQPLL